MIAYLARPIDMARDIDATIDTVACRVLEDLTQFGFTVYQPNFAFDIGVGAKPDHRISTINEAALTLADVVVVLFPEEKTIGTVLELAQAVQSGKPTVVVTEVLDRSWSLAGLDQYENVFLTDGWDSNHAGWLKNMYDMRPTGIENLPPLRYQFLTPDAHACDFSPRRQYSGDAGFDLYVSEDTEIPIGQFKDIPCGIAVQLPPHTWGLIIGRSSTLRTHNLMVTPGVIDNGYRGPLYAGVYNMNGTQFSAKKGMRLAQIIPFPLTAAEMDPQMAPQLGGSDRGEAGFGSTGQ